MKRSRGIYLRRQYFYFKFKNQDGRWVERATRTSNYHQALAIRGSFLRELEDGRLPNERSKWTLKQATSDWLDARKLRVARGTYLSEATITRNLQRALGAENKLGQLANIDAVKRYESSRLRAGVSAKTVNNEVQVLVAILREANLAHQISGSYKPLRVPKTDVGTPLTKEEACKLIQFAQVAHPFAVVPYAAVLAYATGMRSKEIKQLQLGSIHLKAQRPFLYVRRSTTKSNKGARYVALDKIACWATLKLLTRGNMLGATQMEHYLFPTLLEKHTRQADPLHGSTGFDVNHPQSSWDKEWQRLRESVGIEHRRFHDLRHSYITRAAEAGVPLAVTQAQVGHMSVQMVEHYTHICQAAIHAAAEQIEKHSADLLSTLGLHPHIEPNAIP